MCLVLDLFYGLELVMSMMDLVSILVFHVVTTVMCSLGGTGLNLRGPTTVT